MIEKALSPRLRIVAGAALLAMATVAGNAYATVIYNGASFGLSLDSQSGNTYQFTYTADFTNWDAAGAPNQDYIAAANFKPNTGLVPTSYSLLSTNAPGTWTAQLGNANNNGCDTGGSQSFICALASPLNSAPTTTGAAYNWVFSVTYASPLSPSDFINAPIRAWFVDDNYATTGKGTGLMSLSTDITTNVPEPGAISLLGVGLLAFGIFGSARRRKA